MSTLAQVMAALQEQVSATVGGIAGFTSIKVAVGWPSVRTLQSVAKGGTALVTVYDRKVGRNTTRWKSFAYNQVVVPATMTSSVDRAKILPIGPATITLSGTPSNGDAVSCVLTNFGRLPGIMAAQIVQAGASDTLATMATKLAAAIAADSVMSKWVTATASGPTVLLVDALAAPTVIGVQTFTGNGGTQSRELGRRERQLQITTWTRTENDRQAISDPIDLLLGNEQNSFGITTADGTAIRLIYENDYYLEDDSLADVYRRDFLVRVDYPVTTQDKLYAVLALIEDIEPAPGQAPYVPNPYVPSLDYSDPRNSQYMPDLIGG